VGILSETGTDEGVPDVARLDGSVTPRDLDGNRSLQRAVGRSVSCPRFANIGSCLPGTCRGPREQEPRERSLERSVERSRVFPERSSPLDPDLRPNPQMGVDDGSSVYWSDSLRCACMHAHLR
jgi:hypothetical protein